jgi:hypothetical protein
MYTKWYAYLWWSPLNVIQELEHGEFVRVRTVHLNGKPRVLTLKQDLHYWPTWELRFNPETAMWRRKIIKALGCNTVWKRQFSCDWTDTFPLCRKAPFDRKEPRVSSITWNRRFRHELVLLPSGVDYMLRGIFI